MKQDKLIYVFKATTPHRTIKYYCSFSGKRDKIDEVSGSSSLDMLIEKFSIAGRVHQEAYGIVNKVPTGYPDIDNNMMLYEPLSRKEILSLQKKTHNIITSGPTIAQ